MANIPLPDRGREAARWGRAETFMRRVHRVLQPVASKQPALAVAQLLVSRGVRFASSEFMRPRRAAFTMAANLAPISPRGTSSSHRVRSPWLSARYRDFREMGLTSAGNVSKAAAAINEHEIAPHPHLTRTAQLKPPWTFRGIVPVLSMVLHGLTVRRPRNVAPPLACDEGEDALNASAEQTLPCPLDRVAAL